VEGGRALREVEGSRERQGSARSQDIDMQDRGKYTHACDFVVEISESRVSESGELVVDGRSGEGELLNGGDDRESCCYGLRRR